VDAVVHDAPGLDVALLGMSFLNRTEIRREGGSLTLTKRY
jgi:aspartyl protease family protein